MTQATAIFSERAAARATSSSANAFKRVLEGGNWAQSSIYAAAKQSKNDRDRPWVVLVTGLNGVRKTTAIYEPWFEDALAEADCRAGRVARRAEARPAAHRFELVLPAIGLRGGHCCADAIREALRYRDVSEYAKAKAAIFARYRTTSEMVGALLVEEASRDQARTRARGDVGPGRRHV